MMALQLPEPDFYTLAEVAERWGVSEDVLVRMGAENKILMGYPLLYQIANVVRPTQKVGYKGFEALSTEMLRAIGIEPDDIEGADKGYDNVVRFPVGGVAACNWEIGIAIANRRDSFRLDFITGFTLCNASDSAPTPAPTLPYAHHYALCREVLTVSFADLVIPTVEIHRIEHQQEKADQAIAKAEAESPIPSQSRRALNTRAKVIGALVKSHNINLGDRQATAAVMTKLDLQGVGLDRDTVKTILDEAREQIEKPN